VTKPQNNHVIKNSSVTLTCTFDSTVTATVWYEYYTDINFSNSVSINAEVQSGYTTEFVVEGTYNLNLLKSETIHGGKYKCQAPIATGQPYLNAQLIVLGKHNNS
jgi:hypothetical protein